MFTTGLNMTTEREENALRTEYTEKAKNGTGVRRSTQKHTGRARTCVAHTMTRTRAGHAQTDTRPAGRAGSEWGRQGSTAAAGARLGAEARRRGGAPVTQNIYCRPTYP